MKNVLTTLCIAASLGGFSQNIGINTTGAAPDNSALLDISVSGMVGTKRGLLIPRMTTAERNLIPAPAPGLIVLDSTTWCVSVFTGTVWVDICPAATSVSGCSPGMVDFGTFCIETALRPQTDLATAINTCRNLVPSARICNWTEWSSACLTLTIPSMGDNWEWSDGVAQAGNFPVIGGGACFLSAFSPDSTPRYFRCCRPKQ